MSNYANYHGKLLEVFYRGKIICRGKIKERIDSEDEKYLICEVTASNEDDELIASGDATVVFTVNDTSN